MNNQNNQDDSRKYMTWDQVAQNTAQWAKERQEDAASAVTWGFESLDKVVPPLFPSQLALVTALMGYGKCVAGDTLITLKTGEVITMREFVRRRKGEILTLEQDYRMSWVEPTDFAFSGNCETVLVKLRTGREIRCTPEHPLRVPAGWARADSLLAGDHVATIPRCGISDMLEQNVHWDEVLSVTPAGVTDVYDVCVPGTHNFVANGIVAHNTTFLRYMAKRQADIYAEAPLVNGRQRVVLVAVAEEALERQWLALVQDQIATVGAVARGNISYDYVSKLAVKHTGLPIIFVGRTVARDGTYELSRFRRSSGGMTVDVLSTVCEEISKDGQFEVGTIVGDYVQAFSTGDEKLDLDPVQRVSVVSDKIMDLAVDSRAATIWGAQASPSAVTNRPVTSIIARLPYEYEVWNTNRLPMNADVIFTLTMPHKNTKADGSYPSGLSWNGRVLESSVADLMLMCVRKYRDSPTGQIIPISCGGGKYPGARPWGDLMEIK